MIYTITLNPAIDYYIELPNVLQKEEVNRGRNEIYKPAGKGLNVSKVLSLFDIPSKAIAVLGGFTGRYIQEAFDAYPLIDCIPIAVSGNNRINVKAYHQNETIAINGEGPLATNDTQKEILDILQEIQAKDYVIVSGSMMKGFDVDFLIEIAQVVHEKDAYFVLDIEQINLDLLQKTKPFLIKPNRYELGLLFEKDITKEEAIIYLKQCHSYGIQQILLSLGKDGAMLYDGSLKQLIQQNTDLINKVGTGDAMLATYIGLLSIGKTKEEALRYAGAAGNATASSLEDITIDDIERFLKDMVVVDIV